MSDYVRDVFEKIEIMTTFLIKSYPAQTLAAINDDRVKKVNIDEVGQGVTTLSQMFGMSVGLPHHWKNYDKVPNQGFLIMASQFAKFGPADQNVLELFAAYEEKHKVKATPKQMLKALDESDWFLNDLQEACWLAFAGTSNNIAKNKILREFENHSPDGPAILKDSESGKDTEFSSVRGSSSSRFKEILELFSKDKPPSLPQFAYCAKIGKRIGPQNLRPYRAGKGVYGHSVRLAPLAPQEAFPIPASQPQRHLKVPTSFSSELPKRRTDPATATQKFKLYGGALKTYDLGYNPVGHMVNGHSFLRTSANELEQAISKQTVPFSAISVRAQHGEGLSLALAQVAVSLAKRPDVLGYWVIGDPKKTRQLLEEIPEFLNQTRFTNQGLDGRLAKRIVFIVDDLSEVENAPRLQDMQRFHEDLEAFAVERSDIVATVIYGVFGNFPSIVDDIEISLTLSDDDQRACFQKMAEGESRVLRDGPNGLQKIVTENPTSRSYGNDVQAFIDYLLEFGDRTKNADQNWLSKAGDLSGWECALVESAAVSGLLGLSLQANVALQLASWAGEQNVSEVEQIARVSRFLTVVEDDWCGVSLASPRRAQSILRQLRKDDPNTVSQKIFFLFDTALSCYEDSEPGSGDSLEYARHILQRLNKNELYYLREKREASRFVLKHSLERLEELYQDFEPMTAARWAGSLCPLFPVGRKANKIASPLETSLSDLTLSLVQTSLSKLNEKTNPAPELALSLFKAIRRLVSSSLTKRKAQPVLAEVESWLGEDGLIRLVDAIVASRPKRLEYRLNEIFLASTKLKMVCGPAARLRPTEAWFGTFEEKMQSLNLNLDAGSWLERARCARGDQDRSLYLEIAEASAVYNHRSQATWLKAIEQEQKRKKTYVR